ncbi:MAG: hypothetical protein QM831_10530 [Kofleriaceae bacterium]
MKYLVAVLWLAACSSDGNRTITDAPTAPDPDGAVLPGDELQTPVTVQTVPAIAGESVYFQNADSSLVAKVVTDASGRASTVMAAGGFATIVHTIPGDNPGDPPTYRLYTWSGVLPGDVIQVKPGGGEGTVTQPTTFTVKLPVAANGKTYDVTPTCGNASVTPPTGMATTFTAAISSTCAKLDLMVIARATNNALVSSFVVPDITVAAGVTVDLSASTYAPPVSRQITVSHWAGTALHGNTYIETSLPIYYDNLTLASGDPSTTSQTLPAKPTTHRDVTWIYGTAQSSTQYVYQWGEDGNLSIDWSTDATPAFSSTISYDTASHTASWTKATGGATVNAAGIALYPMRANYAFQWNAYGASSTSVALPVLPTDIADFSITNADTITYAIMASVPGGYDALRPVIGLGEPYPPTSSATGKLAFTDYMAILAR